MAITSSGVGNFPAARYAAYISKTILEPGELTYMFDQFMEKLKLDKGYSLTYTIIRRARIKVPVIPTAEGVSPSPQTLALDTVSGTSSQYVISVQWTDVADYVVLHEMITHASISVKDAMERLDAKVCSDAYLANLNIFFANTTYTARTQLLATDALTSDSIRKAVVNLRKGDRVIGAAPRWAGNNYALLINENVQADLRKDATFEAAAIRGQQKQGDAMVTAMVSNWEGCDVYVSQFMPEFTNLGDGVSTQVFTNNTPLSYTSSDTIGTGANGLNINCSGAAGTLAASSTSVIITRIDQYRGFEEDFTTGFTITPTLNNSMAITFPTDSSALSLSTPGLTGAGAINMATSPRFLYNAYAGLASGSQFRVALGALGGSTVTITALPTTGVTAPVAPTVQTSSTNTRIKVYPSWVLGKGAMAKLTLSNLQTFITPQTPTEQDPASQRRTIAAKVHMGSFVIRDQYMARIESGSFFPNA